MQFLFRFRRVQTGVSALVIVFVMSLARSFLSDPHGMIFIHASCDQPLMNSPKTKLSFVIPTEHSDEESQNQCRDVSHTFDMTPQADTQA